MLYFVVPCTTQATLASSSSRSQDYCWQLFKTWSDRKRGIPPCEMQYQWEQQVFVQSINSTATAIYLLFLEHGQCTWSCTIHAKIWLLSQLWYIPCANFKLQSTFWEREGWREKQLEEFWPIQTQFLHRLWERAWHDEAAALPSFGRKQHGTVSHAGSTALSNVGKRGVRPQAHLCSITPGRVHAAMLPDCTTAMAQRQNYGLLSCILTGPATGESLDKNTVVIHNAQENQQNSLFLNKGS